MKDETVTCILTYCVRLTYANGFIIVRRLYLVRMNFPLSNTDVYIQQHVDPSSRERSYGRGARQAACACDRD